MLMRMMIVFAPPKGEETLCCCGDVICSRECGVWSAQEWELDYVRWKRVEKIVMDVYVVEMCVMGEGV